jgi:hypothetical protein
MAFFSKGLHSYNKKYESFSDVHRLAGTGLERGGSEPKAEEERAFPSRTERFGRARRERKPKRRAFRFIFSLRARIRARRAAKGRAIKSALLGYVPAELFVGLCVVTAGMYPYVWMRNLARAFNKIGSRGIDEAAAMAMAVTGFAVQALVPASLAAFAAWRASGAPLAWALCVDMALAYAFLYVSLVFPMRCFNYFSVRWALRRAVAEWDSEGVLAGRAAPSRLMLFLFGSVYIQLHVNRLMGLGMPGFADASEITPDAPLTKRIADFIARENGAPERGGRERWTRDEFLPDYDDYYDG